MLRLKRSICWQDVNQRIISLNSWKSIWFQVSYLLVSDYRPVGWQCSTRERRGRSLHERRTPKALLILATARRKCLNSASQNCCKSGWVGVGSSERCFLSCCRSGSACIVFHQNDRCSDCNHFAISFRGLGEKRTISCSKNHPSRNTNKSTTELRFIDPAGFIQLRWRAVALLQLALSVTVAHIVAAARRTGGWWCRMLNPSPWKGNHVRPVSKSTPCFKQFLS